MIWTQQLKRMKLDHIKATHPGYFDLSGGYSMKVKPYTDKTRNGLTRCVINWINFSGGSAKKTNKGSLRKIDGKMVWMNAPGRKPKADIIGVFKSKSIEIIISHGQVKHSEETPSGWSLIIGSFQDFLDWWNSEILKKIESCQEN